MSSTASRLAVVALTAALAGCATPAIPPGAERGEPLSADDPLPAALLAAQAARGDALNALRGRARVRLDTPQGSLRRPQRIVAERPDRLRVEVLGVLGQTAAVLVTRDGRYAFLDARVGEVERGEASDDLLWRLVQVDLTPGELVALLLGAPEVAGGWRLIGAERFADGHTGVRQRRGARVRRLRFGPGGELLRVERFAPGGALERDVRYADHREVSGRSLAHRIELIFPRVDARAALVFGAVELLPSLPAELFELAER